MLIAKAAMNANLQRNWNPHESAFTIYDIQTRMSIEKARQTERGITVIL